VKASASGAEDSASTEAEGVIATVVDDFTARGFCCNKGRFYYLPMHRSSSFAMSGRQKFICSSEVGHKLIKADKNFRNWTKTSKV